MKSIKFLTSACRYCRHYNPEGRRGGNCQQLGAPVQGHWKACSLALPAFAPSWESLEDAWSLPEATPALASNLNQDALTLEVKPMQHSESVVKSVVKAVSV
ncbi:MAG: hypothetical protein IGS39_07440 [Calothrix sp. C42_A2020_038]|nr:hypothetical protein [Calothrix sp. C42_A2020_038]